MNVQEYIFQGSISLECSDGVAWVHSSFNLLPGSVGQPNYPSQPDINHNLNKDDQYNDDIQKTSFSAGTTLYFDQYGRRIPGRNTTFTTKNSNSRRPTDDNNNPRLRPTAARSAGQKKETLAAPQRQEPQLSQSQEGFRTVLF